MTDEDSPITFASLTPIVLSNGQLSGELLSLRKDYPAYFSAEGDKIWRDFLKGIKEGRIEGGMVRFWSSCRSLGFKARFLMFYLWDEGLLKEAVSWWQAAKCDNGSSWSPLLQYDRLSDREYRDKIGEKERSEDMFFLDRMPGELLDFMIRVVVISRKRAISEYASFGSKYLAEVIRLYNRAVIIILERKENIRLYPKHASDLLKLMIFNSEPFGLGVRYGAAELDGFHDLMADPRIARSVKKEANLIMIDLISQEKNAYIQAVMLCVYTEEMEDSLRKEGYIYGFDKKMFRKSIEFMRNQDNGYPFSPESTLRIFQIWEHYSSLRMSLIKDYVQKEHVHCYDSRKVSRMVIDDELAERGWREVRKTLQERRSPDNEAYVKPMIREIDAALAQWKNKKIRNDEPSSFQDYIAKMNLYI